ncbi:MAG: hypothetical protein AAF615_09030 [Pseudomonadota bacterium]
MSFGRAIGLMRAATLVLVAASWLALSAERNDATGAQLSADQAMALAARVDAFDRAVRTSDYMAMVDAMPPRILGALAEATGTSPSVWKQSAAAMMRAAFDEATVLEFSIRLDGARYGALPDGTPYALIPTTTQIVMNAVGRIESNAATLAIFDNGRWYLMRLNDAAQSAQLRQAYPGFADVALPESTMEFLD